ncbi:MAG: translin family protein [Patescibacteria group bacterium]
MQEKQWSIIKKRKQEYEDLRKKLVTISQEILRASKGAIFAIQRDDSATARIKLATAKSNVANGLKLVAKTPILNADGQWRASIEEYAEAFIFMNYLQGKLTTPKELEAYPDAILGGLSDAAGEMARYSVLRATAGDKQSVEKMHQAVVSIVETLADLDLTGSMRSKFDQSKQHLRRIEDVRYDLSKRSDK